MEKEINYKDYTIEIHQDQDVDSPNQDDRSGAFLVYDHNSFSQSVNGYEPRDIHDSGKSIYKNHHVFRVYAYIHSGVSLSLNRDNYPFNDRWDVSSTGFILVNAKQGKQRINRIQATEIAGMLIDIWNTYLSGDVYYFDIKNHDGESLDSCGGIYGYDNALEDAKSSVDAEVLRGYEIPQRKEEGDGYTHVVYVEADSETLNDALKIKPHIDEWDRNFVLEHIVGMCDTEVYSIKGFEDGLNLDTINVDNGFFKFI